APVHVLGGHRLLQGLRPRPGAPALDRRPPRGLLAGGGIERRRVLPHRHELALAGAGQGGQPDRPRPSRAADTPHRRQPPPPPPPDLWLPVRPGTDLAVLNAMLRQIALDGLVDEAYLRERTTGWEA